MGGGGVIHVAGVIDQREADLLLSCGVKHLGFPFRLAKNQPDLPESDATAIIRSLPSDVVPLLITYLTHPETVIQLCDELGVSYVQLHADISVDELSRLRTLRPGLTVIKSVIVRTANQAELEQQIETTSPYVDGYITDTFDPLTGAIGATGKTHDWSVSRRLVARSPHPLILAGGLNAANVGDAIRAVGPAGVDVHTGIEGPGGRKDPHLTRRFVEEAQAAWEEPNSFL